jgi:hypothetical protein
VTLGTEGDVTYELRGSVAWLGLNRPDKRNVYKYGLDLTEGTLVVVGVRQEEIVSRHAALMLFSLAIGRVSRKVCIGVLP